VSISYLQVSEFFPFYLESFGVQFGMVQMADLQSELLNRAVCLEKGPGVRVPDIDEAIRSTVIAAI